MNIFELFFFLLNIWIGVRLAYSLYFAGGLWAAVLGFVLGVIFLPLTLYSYELLKRQKYNGDFMFPKCECGAFKYTSTFSDKEHQFTCKKCNAKYLRRGDETFIVHDNNMKPYKQFLKKKGWV